MPPPKRIGPTTLVSKITLALVAILLLACATVIASYWLSDRAVHDPHLINHSGSLRMETYRIGFIYQHDPDQAISLLSEVSEKWHHPVFASYYYRDDQTAEAFRTAHEMWQVTENAFINGLEPELLDGRLQALVGQLDRFVGMTQQDAEYKILALRVVLVIALLLTIMLAAVVLFWLKSRFEAPLSSLIQQARHISQGDFTARSHLQSNDELGVLGRTLNKMSDTITYMYGDLEDRVDKQTHEIMRSHKTLQFLYEISREVNEKSMGYHDYSKIVEALRALIKVDDIELCLLTEAGKRPYHQFQPEDNGTTPCITNNCEACVMTCDGVTIENGRAIYRYPLSRDQKQYGVLIARLDAVQRLDSWQQQLLRSVAEQLSLAMNVKSEEENLRRLALMKERTVIARELHDSLAQALSYLKIQVVRLSKATESNNRELLDDVTNELKEGLDSAYRQLRELLTTFRLKVDGKGLLHALETTVDQLEDRTDMQIHLVYELEDVPLTPHEEVHLLQIIREASQNAVNHSQGGWLKISLISEASLIQLSVEGVVPLSS
ncbi:MAG: histidine kinase, partial [Gammaproteobacteria bacterium]|nr:histidine kinase [Gammaproteobacteria bacterium]